jgi:hypothetical protein
MVRQARHQVRQAHCKPERSRGIGAGYFFAITAPIVRSIASEIIIFANTLTKQSIGAGHSQTTEGWAQRPAFTSQLVGTADEAR